MDKYRADDLDALSRLVEAGGSLHQRDIKTSVRDRLIMNNEAEVRLPFIVSITPAGRAALQKEEEGR